MYCFFAAKKQESKNENEVVDNIKIEGGVKEEPDDVYAKYLVDFQTEHETAFKRYIAEYLKGNNLNMNVTKVPKCKITISDFESAIGTKVFHCFAELNDGTAKEMDVILYEYDYRFALTVVNRDVGRTNGMIRAE